MKTLQRICLLALLSILTVSFSLDAGAFLYTAETGAIENPRQFTPEKHDTAAAAYYLGVRYYDPHAGRFISRDPAGDGFNWYAYALNNPLAFIDPSGLRPVNSIERDALLHTFGEIRGAELASIIDVQYDPEVEGGEVRNDWQVFLSPNYATDGSLGQNLSWLSIFVHEAAHIWQRRTGRHRGGRGGEDYLYAPWQLIKNDLKREEHAKAVQTWFFVDFGLKKNLIVANPTPNTQEVSYAWAWRTLLIPLGYSNDHINASIRSYRDYFQNPANLSTHLHMFYKAVIAEIQTGPGQNAPNPF